MRGHNDPPPCPVWADILGELYVYCQYITSLKGEIRTEQDDQTVWEDSGLHIMEIHRLKLMTLLILLLLFISAYFTVSFCLANV